MSIEPQPDLDTRVRTMQVLVAAIASGAGMALILLGTIRYQIGRAHV